MMNEQRKATSGEVLRCRGAGQMFLTTALLGCLVMVAHVRLVCEPFCFIESNEGSLIYGTRLG